MMLRSNKDPNPAVASSRQALRYLRLSRLTYLDSSALTILHVKCTGIDIENGIPRDEGLKVLEPKPFDEMNAIVEANELIRGRINIPSSEYSPGNWHTADFQGNFYLNLIKSTFGIPDPPNKTSLQHISPWKIDQKNVDEYVDRSKIHWRTNFTLYSHDMPDIVCFLANEAPLEDDKLLSSELRCILRMGGANLRRQEYSHHKIAPVTVISASNTNVRIVQGYVDADKNCFFVRKSDIINIDGDEKRNFKGLVSIARWFFGKPCREEGEFYMDS